MFVVDLSGLDFADCAGISILVWAQKRLAAGGSELVVTGAKPIVRRLLQLTGLDTYLHLGTPESQNDPRLAKHSQVVRHGPGPGWSAHSV
jgi:anti-anti-sigma factor